MCESYDVNKKILKIMQNVKNVTGLPVNETSLNVIYQIVGDEFIDWQEELNGYQERTLERGERVEETDIRFEIKESTIPNAGLGLFAKVKITKGDYLEVIGVCVKYGGIADQCSHYANRYKFAAEPEKEFVNALIPVGYAAMVNHPNSKEQQNVSLTHLPEKVPCKVCHGVTNEGVDGCEQCNGSGYCVLVPRNPAAGRTIYAAIRDIESGEEILGNYGKKIGQLVLDGQTFKEEDKKEWNKFLKRDLYGLSVLLDK